MKQEMKQSDVVRPGAVMAAVVLLGSIAVCVAVALVWWLVNR